MTNNNLHVDYEKVRDYLNFNEDDYISCWVVIIQNDEDYGWDLVEAFDGYLTAEAFAKAIGGKMLWL